MPTKIEWCQETYNPIIGCSKISAGCQNCYAEKMAFRLANMGIDGYEVVVNTKTRMIDEDAGTWTGKTYFVESALEKPLHWKKPRKIFVCSMGDLFHESVPFEWIDRVMAVIALCPHHTFLMLTKRAERMKDYFAQTGNVDYVEFVVKTDRKAIAKTREIPLSNLWLGVTAENQEMADKRIPVLLGIPAVKRFVSVEPMLEKVILFLHLVLCKKCGKHKFVNWITNCFTCCDAVEVVGSLDWVICGGETGHNARQCDIQWVRDLRDHCEYWNVPFFFKKFSNGETKIDGKEYREFPK